MEEDAGVGGEAPVVVFAAAVDAGEGFFVEEDAEAVLAGHALHQGHQEHVVVDGEVGVLEDGGHFKLVRGDLVVAGFAGDAEFEGLDFEVLHEGGDALRDGAEVVVVHLLVLGGIVAHEGAAGQQEVGTGAEEALVDEEVLLLPAEVGGHFADLRVEVVADGRRGLVDGFEGAQERGLVVEGFAGVGDEDRGDDEGVVDDEDRGSRVPGGIAAGFEGRADAAAGEAAGVRLLLDKHLAGEIFDHAALAVEIDEGIVLFGGAFGQGLEPVGVVRDPVFAGPLHHAFGDGVGNSAVESRAAVHHVDHLLKHVRGQVTGHFLPVEHLLSEVFARPFFRRFYLYRLFPESPVHHLESQF